MKLHQFYVCELRMKKELIILFPEKVLIIVGTNWDDDALISTQKVTIKPSSNKIAGVVLRTKHLLFSCHRPILR
jgi:hypothetical protein